MNIYNIVDNVGTLGSSNTDINGYKNVSEFADIGCDNGKVSE